MTADPGYEAGMLAAGFAHAKVAKVPLKPDYVNDVKAMAAADPNAGVFYICNPNNPTGTITSKKDIEWLHDNKPKGSILLVDEAYIHLSDAESVIDMVKADKDVIILRTFSKVYGMAGIRCGFAIGRPDLLDKLHAYSQNAMPITAASAATASLLDDALVPTRKKIIAGIRNDTFAWLAANNYAYIPSQTNCFMIDTKRDGQGVFNAHDHKKGLHRPRVAREANACATSQWAHSDEMAKFRAAFKEVMDETTTAALATTQNFQNVPFSHLG